MEPSSYFLKMTKQVPWNEILCSKNQTYFFNCHWMQIKNGQVPMVLLPLLGGMLVRHRTPKYEATRSITTPLPFLL